MKSYYYDNTSDDQRQSHDSGESVDLKTLEDLGVLYYHIDPDSNISEIDNLAQSRNYKNRDEITVSPSAMGDVYEQKVRMFFNEHLHEDEEIRYILDGAGYFDVRKNPMEDEEIVEDKNRERWVRIRLTKGDLLILPAGIYHRFTTDEDNYIRAMRLFKDEPKWTPLNRGPDVDANPHRLQYLASLKVA